MNCKIILFIFAALIVVAATYENTYCSCAWIGCNLEVCKSNFNFMEGITLTQGKVAIIDDEDFDLVDGYAWYAKCKHGKWIAEATYKDAYGVRRHIKMHRLIMGVTDPKILVDHSNRNGLLNTRHNLRIATDSQNKANADVRIHKKTSKYLGVFPTTNKTKSGTGSTWRVQLSKNNIKYYMSAKTEIEAARIYNALAKHLHGEFACLNVIP